MGIGINLSMGLKFIIRKIFSSIFFRVLGLLSGLVFTWLIASKFGTYALGVMSVNLAVIYISIVFLKLGIDTHVVFEVARLRAENKSFEIRAYFLKTTSICVITSLIGTSVIYFISDFLGNSLNLQEGGNYLKTTSLCLLPLMLLHLNAAFMRAFKKVMAFSFFLNGGVSFLSLILILPIIDQTDDFYIPLYVQLCSIIALSIVSMAMVLRLVKPYAQAEKCISYKQILKQSLPMMVTLAVHPIWNWGAILILGVFIPVSSVGIFQLLLKCSNLIGLPIRAISTIMAPVVSEQMSKRERGGMKAVIKKTSSLSFLLSLPVILITVLFSKSIMGFFGQEFIPFWYLLILLSLAKFINACYGPMGIIFIMTGNQNLQSKLSLIELSFYLITTAISSWQWGLDGAAAAMFISILFRNLLIGSQIQRIFGVYPFALRHVWGFVKVNFFKHA